jgi:hypothetical protein
MSLRGFVMIALLLAAQIGSSTLALREREFVEKIRPVVTADAFEAFAGMCEPMSPDVQERLDYDMNAAIKEWSSYFGLNGGGSGFSFSTAMTLVNHLKTDIANNEVTQYSCRQLTEGRVLRQLDRLSYSFEPHTPLAAPP